MSVLRPASQIASPGVRSEPAPQPGVSTGVNPGADWLWAGLADESLAIPDGSGRRIVHIDAKENCQRVVAIWQELCGACRHAFYVSPGWVENWLACLTPRFAPILLLVLEGNEPVAAYLATFSRQRRGGLMPSRVLTVYGSGDYAVDRIAPIYNAILSPAGPTLPLRELLEHFPLQWDEAVLPGLDPEAFPGNSLDACDPRWIFRDYDKPVSLVELTRFDRSRDGYLGLLSPNVRSQIRRSRRLYAKNGEVQVRAAASVEEALDMAQQLYALSRQRKAQQNIQCSIDAFFEQFHDRLIRKRFQYDEVQLLHVYTDVGTIGYLYNHIYDGVVYAYQSGFFYTDDNRLKPGLVSHVEAIIYNAKLGHTKYDFGAGGERYKKSLSTCQLHMPWVRLLRPSLKMAFFKSFKSMLESLRAKRNVSSGGEPT